MSLPRSTEGATGDLSRLEEAVRLSPMNGRAWGRLGQAYREAEHFELAIEAFTQATRLEPERPQHWWGLSVSRSGKGEKPLALEAARQAAKLAPDEPVALANLGRQLLRSGRTREAIVVLHDVVLRDPSWAWPRGLLGLAHYQAEDYASAAESLETALRMDPEQQVLWPRLGVSLDEIGRHDGAAYALETALFASPRDGWVWGRMGKALHHLGRHSEAVKAFEKAIDLGFAPAGLWEHLGRSAAALGQVEGLERACAALRDRDPDGARSLRELLGRLLARASAGETEPRRTRAD